jgi:hypothetical protein
MSSTDRLTARETEILSILETTYSEKKTFALVGGYAVDAYSSLPRYSVDCDMVVSKKDFDDYDEIFTTHKYENKGTMYRNELDGLETRKYEKLVGKDAVSIDLLVNGVRCRQAGAIWRYEEIFATSGQLEVIGLYGRVLSSVASKELLIAMKLHSGRDPDLKDVVMLAEFAKWKIVSSFAKRGDRQKVLSQLDRAMSAIAGETFEEQLKSFFGSKKTEMSRINATIREVENIGQELDEEGKDNGSKNA